MYNKIAVVRYTNPEDKLRGFIGKIKELKNNEEIKDLDEEIKKDAVVKNKTPEAKLRGFIEKIEELKTVKKI